MSRFPTSWWWRPLIPRLSNFLYLQFKKSFSVLSEMQNRLKQLRSGVVLVEVVSKPMAKRALSMTTWLDTETRVTPHIYVIISIYLNSSRSVIRCRDFRDCDDDLEVMDALRSQGVIDVKYIQAKKDNILQPTNTFILTFSSPSPPKSVIAAYML